jgi:hypothetical protein
MTPTIKMIFAVVILLGLPLTGQLVGQKQSAKKITFHVTAVRSGKALHWCQSDDCSATRFTVEGYSDVTGDSHLTEYVLECVEVLSAKPSPIVCDRVHANNDYDARLWEGDIVFVEPSPTVTDGAMRSTYHIVSEKEVDKRKR